ncbi:hypothetical protein [Amycolatopsis suaedae]|uniref:PE domain-containing protein n=1 Tax=Amycolatopsis suaedae TaxID=2510978 RepID=A0A4Q7JBP3_9PSEU|nr:hypothetical protein [Amycolatopsis suaedae]RZQ65251.1 hypothetical protein EWH70_05025 [Amycolatopsis suaedae]
MSDNENLVTNAFYTKPAGGSGLPTTVPGIPGAADLQIEPDKVGAVAKVIVDQADALEERLSQKLAELRIDAPSADVVSTKAVEAWNDVITVGEGSYEKRVRAYVQNLRTLADQIRAAARTYRADDDATAESLGERRVFPV